MARYSYHQLDANHKAIRAGLEAIGATVDVKGPLDLLVGFRGANYLLEVKTATGKVRPSQERFLSRWKGQAVVVRNMDEALRAIGAIRCRPGSCSPTPRRSLRP
jgi:hypothetical protein